MAAAMMGSPSLREQMKRLREGKISGDELYRLIHEFGEAKFIEAEPDVVAALRHDDYLIRYIAAMVLTYHWDLVAHRDDIERLMEDPDPEVRRVAAGGLGFLLRETQDRHATRLLIRKLRDATEEGSVRNGAYHALLAMWVPATKDNREVLEGLRHELSRSALMAKELEGALKQSREALEAKLAFWRSEWESRIDWELVAAIERGEVPDRPSK